MNKKIEVLQEDKIDCGAACLLSIIRYYGGNVPLEEVKDLVNTSKNGTNALDIIKGAKEIGLEAVGRKMTFDELIKSKHLFPLIAHIKKGNFYHFIVIYNCDESKEKLAIMDPTVGIEKITFNDFKEKYLGTVLIFSKRRDLPNIKNDNHLLKVIFSSLVKDKKRIILLVIVSLLVFFFNLLEILLFRYLTVNKVSRIISYICILALFIIVKESTVYLRNKIFLKLKYYLDKKVNDEAFERLMRLPLIYYKNKTTGEIVSRIDDLDMLKDIILDMISNVFINFLLILVSLYLLFKEHILLAFISLSFICIYFAQVLVFTKKYKKKARYVQESKGFYTSTLIEKIEGYETISNLNIQESETDIIKNAHNKYLKSSMSVNTLFAINELIKSTLFTASNILVILISSYYLELSEVMIVYILFSYLSSSVKSILDGVPNMYFAFMNLDKVNRILVHDESMNRNVTLNGNIVFKSIEYEVGGKKILSNLNLKVKKGSKVFLTGQSGKGKSTLLRILMKYNPRYKGEVYIGKYNLKEIHSEEIAKEITYVSQNEVLFTGTIKHNLVLNRDISDEKLDKVIEICSLKEVINARKLLLDSMVEEGGFNLSGGERQRIILARALLKDSNYLLIDEALSEVDLSLEKKIVTNILNEFRDKTIIYVSHKKEMKELFEKIFDIEGGNYDRRRT